MNGNEFGEVLLDFIYAEHKEIPELFLRQSLLNYLGAVRSGYQTKAVNIAAETIKSSGSGRYAPLRRTGLYSLADCALLDCFASSVQAYDDIHFGTSTHPCGPVASVILAVARTEKVNMAEALKSLYVGMETECRIAEALFSEGTGAAKGWYPTGIAGTIGAAAAAGILFHLNRGQMKSSLGLASSYACGMRGTHGSMAGTFVPAVGASNGLRAALLAKNGFTCSFQALTGKNGLFCQIAPQPAFEAAADQIGTYSIAAETSCKPYPLGYISFPLIDVCRKVKADVHQANTILFTISSRAYALGGNPDPADEYQAIVSLPFIGARALLDFDKVCVPLDDSFAITPEERKLMRKIALKEDTDLRDDQAVIEINGCRCECTAAEGAVNNPMPLTAVVQKYRRISNDRQSDKTIHLLLEETPDDLWKSIYTQFEY